MTSKQAFPSPSLPKSSGQPAIILITADQLRKDALGCYGGSAISTPHLDRLAGQGTQFARAYTASPWCLPSRCSLLTGLYPHNHGAYSNFRDDRLSPTLPNLYTELKNLGYTAAHIGKCHYAPVPYGETRPDRTLPYDAFRDYYLSLGIDHLELQDDKQVSAWFYDDYSRELDAAGYLAAYREAVWNPSYRKVFTFPGPAEWHPDSWVGRKAASYLQGYARDEPLFMWVSLSGPHFPFDPPAEYLGRVDPQQVGEGVFREGEWDDPSRLHHVSYYGGPNSVEGAPTKDYSDAYWRTLRRNYFANVALIDDEVGRILEAAERRFGDEVLVIFTADHGEMLGDHRLWGKHNCGYESVLNVPLLVRFPDTIPTQTDAKVMLTDVLPTCLEVAGGSPLGFDGSSLTTKLAQGGDSYVFSEGEGFATVSDGDHKLVLVRQGEHEYHEMFDLKHDPYEFENVIAKPEYAARRVALQQALLELFMARLLP